MAVAVAVAVEAAVTMATVALFCLAQPAQSWSGQNNPSLLPSWPVRRVGSTSGASPQAASLAATAAPTTSDRRGWNRRLEPRHVCAAPASLVLLSR